MNVIIQNNNNNNSIIDKSINQLKHLKTKNDSEKKKAKQNKG